MGLKHYFPHGLRIHPHYREKGFGTQLILTVRELVGQNYRDVLRERYRTGNTHHARLAIAVKTRGVKTPDKLPFQQDSYAFVIKKDRIQLSKLDGLNSSCLSLECNYDVEKSARSPIFSERTKRKIKQCLGKDINFFCVYKILPVIDYEELKLVKMQFYIRQVVRKQVSFQDRKEENTPKFLSIEI